jgi:hypothetical protein
VQYEDAVAAIRDRLAQPQVFRLNNAIAARRDILRDLRSALVTVGADIVIEGRISGQAYLTGLSGRVQAVYDDKYADLLLDEKSTTALAAVRGKNAYTVAEGTTRHLLTGMPLAAFAVTDAAATFTEVIEFILGQATEAQLDSLDKVRAQRRDQLATDLAVGDRVMLADIGRKYLAGLSGTVQTIDRAKSEFSLLLDEPSTERLRYHGRNNRIMIPNGVKEYLLQRVAIGCALITSPR